MKYSKLQNNKGFFFEGPLILSPEILKDNRGKFFESWNKKTFKDVLKQDINFLQDNVSISQKGVLRGMHYQIPEKVQSKLVRCTNGSVFDVIVDLRENSKSFGLWGSIEINSKNNIQIWIPEGFAHGFLSLEDNTIFEYKVTNYWSRKHERSLFWNDIEIGIKWPELGCKKIISEKDLNSKSFKDIKFNKDYF